TGRVGCAVVAVAVASTVLELLSGSVDGAAADGSAIESVLRVAALLALLGAAALGVLVRRVKV
ncbi:hypothetical protein ACFV0D_38510, partial [Streptomyces sp. NPDC059556]|uniref:hypothetical protein n=1 Tax=Streptomyces sp. NPDC059556 TaxID=3346863 RepID=UPI003680ABB8